MAIAFLVPWLLLRDIEVLKIRERELREMTPTASEAVRDRQDLVADLQTWVPAFVVVFVLLGGVLMLLGMRRMRAQQALEDRQLKAQTEQAEASIQEQSEEEKTTRIAEEQAVEHEVVPAGERQRVPRDDAHARVREIEQQVLRRIRDLYGPGSPYELHLNPKVTSPSVGRDLLLDALLRDRTGRRPDIIVDIRLPAPAPYPS